MSSAIVSSLDANAGSTLPHLGLQTAVNIGCSEVEIPPTTFPNFPKFAPELRLKIWGLAAEFPQVIGLRSAKLGDVLEGTTARCHLLSVSKEARSEVLRMKQDLYHASQNRQSPKLYVNLDFDTIWLTDPSITWKKVKRFSPVVKRLAIDYRLWYGETRGRSDEDEPFFPRHLLAMDVNEVVIVVKSEEIGENENTVFITPREGPHLNKHQNPARYGHSRRTRDRNWEERAVIERLDLRELADTAADLVSSLIRSIETPFHHNPFESSY
jgi:hypothetical protein